MFTSNVLKMFRKTFGPWVTAAPSRSKPRLAFKPRLEGLEERWCPSGGDPSNDTLVWKPVGGSQDAGDKGNWYDQTQATQGVTAPTGTNPTLLDGSVSNSPITTTLPLPVLSLTVQGNYNNTLTIKNGGTVTTYASDIVKNGSMLTIVSADIHGILLSNNNTVFTIESGATVKMTDPAGATSGGAYLDRSTGFTGEYLNNAGTVSWTGTKVASGQQAIIDGIGAPVLNTGTFNLDGGTGGDTTAVGGDLHITGFDPATNNAGFDMTSGAVNLTNGAMLSMSSDYYQSGGSLTSDATTCIVETGSRAPGDINIAGGKVVVDNVANTVATLKFIASTVEINGEIDLNGLTQQGGRSTRCDLLDCGSAAVTLQTNSFLNVGTTGTAALGTGNQWVVMKYGSITNSWGRTVVPATMTPSTGATQVLVSN